MAEDDRDEETYLYMGGPEEIVPLDVKYVRIHHSVRRIHARAFRRRSQLRTVTDGDGLEAIGRGSFDRCESLCEIMISPTVRSIDIEEFAFSRCSQLRTVTGGDGLEFIEGNSFARCKSLCEIMISPTVSVIKEHAFCRCSHLRTVTGGDGLELGLGLEGPSQTLFLCRES